MTPDLDKQGLLAGIADILRGDSAITRFVYPDNISVGASDFNHLSSAIDVCDGGDELVTEIRRQTVVNIVIKTYRPSINASDLLCSQIEDAVINCIYNHSLDAFVSRFVELSSEALQSSDDPLVRSHVVAVKFEVV